MMHFKSAVVSGDQDGKRKLIQRPDGGSTIIVEEEGGVGWLRLMWWDPQKRGKLGKKHERRMRVIQMSIRNGRLVVEGLGGKDSANEYSNAHRFVTWELFTHLYDPKEDG